MRSTRAWTAAGCLLAAAVSVAAISALSYDAWGWLMWGREIVGALPFTTDGYPTWKPLTGLISIPLAPLGAAAPTLWLLIARAGAIATMVLAYRLAARAGGRWAGALAAVSVLLMPEWLFQAGVGGSEPLLTALLLAAVERHADRDHGRGFLLVLLASLLRPEAWPALGVSALVAWRQERLRPYVAAGLAAVPVLWFGGEYIGSGDPFRGGHLAKISLEAKELQRGPTPPVVTVLGHAWKMVLLPLLVCAPPALVGAWRRRDPVLLALGVGGVAWLGEVITLTALGYAGVTRFMFPAAAALAVVGAVGLVRLVRALRWPVVGRLALALAFAALLLPTYSRLPRWGHQAARVEARADLDVGLQRVVARVGRHRFLAASHVSAEGIEITALAWRIGVIPEPMRHTSVPGLALALRHRPWPPFWRAVRRGGFERDVRTVAHSDGVTLLSVAPLARAASRP